MLGHNSYSQNYNLVISYDDGRPFADHGINDGFTHLLESAGLPHVKFHSLRHSSTSYKLALSGGNIKAVQGDNGHSQPNMVLSVYAQIQDHVRADIASKVNEDFCIHLE